MAKSMAQIVCGVVTNILWCADSARQSETLIPLADRPVGIGDTYDGGKFYRDGVAVLTPEEAALVQAEALRTQLAELDEAYAEGVNSV